MRPSRLAFAVLAALGLAVHAARSNPTAAAGIELEICRLPGTPAEYSDQEIDLPAHTVFVAAAIALGDDGKPEGADAPRVGVVTLAPIAIAAGAFCTRAPIGLVDPAENSRIRARLGSMFLPRTNSSIQAALSHPLDAVYGLLRSKSD